MFGCEGGGSSGSGIETVEKFTFGSRLDTREIEERWCCCGFRCCWGFGCCRSFALSFRSGGEDTSVGMGG